MFMKESSLFLETQELNSYIQQPIKTVDGEIHLKKYLKIKSIGRGSYSNCFLVKNIDSASASTYAVKVIPKNKLETLIKEKLFYEIKIHQSLSHPHVVYLDHWFEDMDYQYIFMEYCSNGNLDSMVRILGGTMSEKHIKSYGYQIVQSIHYIHSQHILHRDLKLNNFYLNDSNMIKLGDFGFACQLANEYDRKRQSCGTPNYIAPEAISGFGYSFSSDVWSIGVILYRLKFGFCPFEGGSVKETLEKVRICQYQFPKGVSISRELKDLITKIFNINYDDRLTTQQIFEHPFFRDVGPEEASQIEMPLIIQSETIKRKSLFNKVFAKKTEKDSYGKSGQQPNRQMKKSNSCQTLKEIKEIFKSKNKKDRQVSLSKMHTLPTQSARLNTNEQTSIYLTHSLNTLPSMSFDQHCLSTNNHMLKRSESGSRLSRLNKFIKDTAINLQKYEQPAVSMQQVAKHGDSSDNSPMLPFTSYKSSISSMNKMTSNSSSSFPDEFGTAHKKLSKQLSGLLARFYLPYWVQHEKDVIVVHYTGTLKQIIYSPLNCQNRTSLCYIVYFGSGKQEELEEPNSTSHQQVFSASRNSLSGLLIKEITNHCELPKIVAYILQNKLPAQQPAQQPSQYSFPEDKYPAFNRILHHVESTDKSEQLFENLDASETIQVCSVRKMLSAMGQQWTLAKEGIILKYYQHSMQSNYSPQPIFTVCKLKSCKQFYLRLNGREPNSEADPKSKNKARQAFLYEGQPLQQYRVVEDIGSIRMYLSWSRNYQNR